MGSYNCFRDAYLPHLCIDKQSSNGGSWYSSLGIATE
jgi:hypothetical protein